VSAERMLVNLIRRAQVLVHADEPLTATEELKFLLKNKLTLNDFNESKEPLNAFAKLDDNDIWGGIKAWKNYSDPIISMLSRMLLERRLFQIRLSTEPIKKTFVENIRTEVSKHYNTLISESSYLFSYGTVSNEAYTDGKQINILTKSGELVDIAQASDLPNIKALSKIVKKNYLCWPKDVSLRE
jgi:hypothetical protein